jgi:sporulation protein YlmC with PRC-barrel domain
MEESMQKSLLAGLAASALIAAPALAQTTAPATPTPPAASSAPAAGQSASGAAMSGQFIPMRQPEQFRASDFIGERVYGANDENIGEINDVIMDAKGQIAGVIIGVGGFLGIGEKDIALPMSALQFRNDPPATGTTAPAGGGTPAAQDDDGVPNRIVVSMTKDQLQQAPAFRDK